MAPYPEVPPPAPQSSGSGCKIAAIVVGVVCLVMMCFGGAIVGGLFLVAIPKAREAANRSNCQSNLRQIGLAVHQFNTNIGYLPNQGTIDGKGNQITTSLFYVLLPNVEQYRLFKQGFTASQNTSVKVFLCPSDSSSNTSTTYATSSYVLSEPIFNQPKATITVVMADGTSNTVMGSERLQNCNGTLTFWADTTIPTAQGSPGSMYHVPGLTPPEYKPSTTVGKMNIQAASNQTQCVKTNDFQSAHPGGVQVLMGDGGMHVLPTGYDPTELTYWCTPSGRATYGQQNREDF